MSRAAALQELTEELQRLYNDNIDADDAYERLKDDSRFSKIRKAKITTIYKQFGKRPRRESRQAMKLEEDQIIQEIQEIEEQFVEEIEVKYTPNNPIVFELPRQETVQIAVAVLPFLAPIQELIVELDKFLHQPNKFTEILGILEQTTGIGRVYLVAGITLFYALYLLFGHFAALLCTLTGFLYPAYICTSVIESEDKEKATQWLTYWIVFALLSVTEFSFYSLTYYIPFYWFLKCAFILWLYPPITFGAQVVYSRFIRPFTLKYSN